MGEQAEFVGPQRDRLAAITQLVRGEIDAEIAVLNPRARRSRGGADGFVKRHPVEHGVQIERAGHVIIGSGLERAAALFAVAGIKHHGDMNGARRAGFAQAAAQLDPGHRFADPVNEGPGRPVQVRITKRGIDRNDPPIGSPSANLANQGGLVDRNENMGQVGHGWSANCQVTRIVCAGFMTV